MVAEIERILDRATRTLRHSERPGQQRHLWASMVTRAGARDHVTLSSRASLHARPAALLVQVANGFACEVRVFKAGGGSASGKSILGS